MTKTSKHKQIASQLHPKTFFDALNSDFDSLYFRRRRSKRKHFFLERCCIQMKASTIIRMKNPTTMRFELTRAKPKGLAVPRLNHSATSSLTMGDDIISTWRA